MRTSHLFAAALLGVLAAGAPLAAHHSFAAEFDGSKPVTLKGTVTKMEWTNPHAWLHVDVKGNDGKAVEWLIEGGAPNALLRRGWNVQHIGSGGKLAIHQLPEFARVDGDRLVYDRLVDQPLRFPKR